MVSNYMMFEEGPREMVLFKLKNRRLGKVYHYCLQFTKGREKRRWNLLGGV